MTEISSDKILNVKNKPQLQGGIELKSLDDLKKLIAVGNLACLYEDDSEKIYFIQNFFFKENK